VRKYLRVGLVAGVAFVMTAAASASANAPLTVTRVVTFEEVVAPGARPVATDPLLISHDSQRVTSAQARTSVLLNAGIRELTPA
jgi:hypothetical protein